MKIVLTTGFAVLVAAIALVASDHTGMRAESPTRSSPAAQASCGCNSIPDMTARLKGVEAVLQLLATQTRSSAANAVFDPNSSSQDPGDAILETLATEGGIGSIVVADIDRFSCDISTGPDLSGIPGAAPASFGSACLRDAASTQLAVRRQVCMTGRNASNSGSDYWEGRRMAEVFRELTDAYTAEARFLRNQHTRLGPSCSAATRKPAKNLCDNCVHFMFDGTMTLPVVGTIRMWADEMIPFDVHPDRTISGWGTINTILDMSGSPCTMKGYNGAADFDITGQISGRTLSVRLVPRGASQRVSAAMSMKCPPDGRAHVLPQSQSYTVTEQMQVPGPGQQFTEKRLDVGQLTRGGMRGEIVLRLSMKPL